MCALMYNKDRKRKDQKEITDLFPFLSEETPDFLEDEEVLLAKKIRKSIDMCPSLRVKRSRASQFNDKMDEVIQEALSQTPPLTYRAQTLRKLKLEL